MMSEFIGPALPPGLRSARDEKKEEAAVVIGPDKSVSDAYSVGPQLPPNLSTARAATRHDDDPSEAASFSGPSLPSSSTSDSDLPITTRAGAVSATCSYGPSLPPGFIGGDLEEESKQPLTNSKVIGPALPPGECVTEIEGDEGGEEEEDRETGEGEDDVIGPMPMVGGVNEAESTFRRRREFDSRSKAMKDKLLGKVHTPPRSVVL